MCCVVTTCVAPAGHDAEASVPPEHRNTYLGVIDRLKDIKQTGATAVLLGNVFLSSTKPSVSFNGNGTSATAGGPEVRRPLSFFAPDTRCACSVVTSTMDGTVDKSQVCMAPTGACTRASQTTAAVVMLLSNF